MASEDQTGAAKPASKAAPRAAEDSVYVVQRLVELAEFAPSGAEPPRWVAYVEAWVDVGEPVKLPARSHRRKAIAKAFADAGIRAEAEMDPPRVRVLDADSAHVTQVGVVVADPKFDV